MDHKRIIEKMDGQVTTTTQSSAWSYPGLWVGIFGLLIVIIVAIILIVWWNQGADLTNVWWIWILLALGFIMMIAGFMWYAFSGPSETEVKSVTTATAVQSPIHQSSPYPYGTLINQVPLVPETYRAPSGAVYRRDGTQVTSPQLETSYVPVPQSAQERIYTPTPNTVILPTDTGIRPAFSF